MISFGSGTYRAWHCERSRRVRQCTLQRGIALTSRFATMARALTRPTHLKIGATYGKKAQQYAGA
jgi:hypothetical protein